MSRYDISGVTSDLDLMNLWLSGRPTSTRAVYEPVARNFLDQFPQGMRQLTVADVLRWAERLEGAPATRARHVATLKSLLSFAWRTGYTPINVGRLLPCVKVPNTLHEKLLEEEDVKSLLKWAKSLRNQSLVRVFYVGGLRISEAVTIRWIDVSPGRITVLGKGTRNRTVVVPKSLTDDLLKLKPRGASAEDFVFRSYRDKPLSTRGARDILYRIADSAALKLSPHSLRHTMASHSLERGAPLHVVRDTLGHANIATTSRYLHVRPGHGASQYLPEV